MTHPFRVSKHPPAKASPSQGVGRKHPAPLTSQRARLARPTLSPRPGCPRSNPHLSGARVPPRGGGGWSWPGPCVSSSPGGVKLGASGSLPFPGPPPGPPESAARRRQRVILWKEGGAARTGVEGQVAPLAGAPRGLRRALYLVRADARSDLVLPAASAWQVQTDTRTHGGLPPSWRRRWRRPPTHAALTRLTRPRT